MYIKSVKNLIASFLVLQIFVAGIGSSPVDSDSRIVGGVAINISQAPYIVKVQYRYSPFCGGTLVKPLYVLSAAHCFEDTLPSDITVVGGATGLYENGVLRKVLDIISHPSYNPSTYNNDVAVLKLAASMTGINISPIGLFVGNLQAGTYVRISGWGDTSEGGTQATSLRTVQVQVVGTSVCRSKYAGEIITPQMFCAASPNKDSCQGDSGGPVVYNGQLCGIVSWGYGCAQPAYPGVYTNVSSVRNFINSNMV